MFFEAHLEEGVKKKRLGDFEGAKESYYRAISIRSDDPVVYFSLGKVCYLNNDREEAIAAYLTCTHQLLCFNNKTNYLSLQQLLSCDKSLIQRLESVHPCAKFIAIDPNTPRHLAHAWNDLGNNNNSLNIAKEHIITYIDSISGNGNKTNDKIENIYHMHGIELLLKHIEWSRIDEFMTIAFYNSKFKTNVNRGFFSKLASIFN